MEEIERGLKMATIDPAPTSLIIEGFVRIDMKTGDIEYLNDYRPKESAQQFWKCIVSEYKDFLAWKQEKCRE